MRNRRGVQEVNGGDDSHVREVNGYDARWLRVEGVWSRGELAKGYLLRDSFDDVRGIGFGNVVVPGNYKVMCVSCFFWPYT